MSSITISNLQPTGLNLFSDDEGYLNDLTDTEQNIQGGLPIWWLGAATATLGAFTVGFAGAALYYSSAKCSI
ncbi:hypothetical protein [Chroococcus sp. FPU101]|uniref:hypothetical protein n=1 Tax=Chroococcus sp. FPU101 TaxID=1974212 RepID=UPI001A8C5396|nr:hypothetical protein [Chroococcus sp. FPU101]GFE68854.1 hypothetical protein CFPU101_14640 [Chroococcus sp. FPU101]